MVIYVDLTKDEINHKESSYYKTLRLAWQIDKFKVNLEKLTDKGYTYFKINGKRTDIESFSIVKGSNFETKTFYADTNIYKFLKLICEKFVYVTYSEDVGVITDILDVYTHSKGFKMQKLEIKNLRNNYDVCLLYSTYKFYNLKISDIIPIYRGTNSNNVKIDYKKLKENYLNK